MPNLKTLGERCKFYEQNFGQGSYLMSLVPALCRIDGRAFHSFCKGLPRPYDQRLSDLMVDTLRFLVKETGAVWGYTQSDEISLCWYVSDKHSQIFFDGRRQKIESMTASLATYYFNKHLPNTIPEKENVPGLFDSRVWSVPNCSEAISYAIWRERDATKNSITMAASSFYSHAELQGKNSADKHELLHSKGVNWNDYPAFFKRGTFMRSTKQESIYSGEELDKLPKKHAARTNPGLTFTRNVIESIDMKGLDKVENKVGVLFKGESPVYK